MFSHELINFWAKKVKGQGQGHEKGQKHIFSHISGLSWARKIWLTPLDSWAQGLHSWLWMTFQRSKKVKTANDRKFDLQISKMKIFIFNGISLKFCQKLLTVTRNMYAKFQNDRFSRLGVKAVSVSQKRPIPHNGRPELTKFQNVLQPSAQGFKPITFKLTPYISTCRRTTSLTFERKRSKVKAKVTQKVKNTFLAISRDSVELERFSWHLWIAELKAYTPDYEWHSKGQKRSKPLTIENLTF